MQFSIFLGQKRVIFRKNEKKTIRDFFADPVERGSMAMLSLVELAHFISRKVNKFERVGLS